MSENISNEKKPFYITTTLPYVNNEPHVGFAMELIRADVIARWKKLEGYDVFFNTGTDEHGQKLLTEANKVGVKVEDFVTKHAETFRGLIELLNIDREVHFIRTTDVHHEKAAQEFWRRCDEAGYIYKKNYQVKYCVGCELEKTESEVENGRCVIHPNLEIELIDEENYFFKFSAFGEKLLKFYEDNPKFVVPDFRYNEIKSFVSRGLEDFSISRLRSKMSWGVEVPGDSNHVMYVWFDALVNYISTLGWPENEANFERFWANGTPIQYCGKDNLRQQSAMWQAMLMAAGLPNSSTIVIDGFLTGDGGVKMSKSLGNVTNPYDIVKEYGTDALRYFLLREVSSFEDSPFTNERFKQAYNSGLANGLGNLVSRVMTMAVNNDVSLEDKHLNLRKGLGVTAEIKELIGEYKISEAMNFIFKKVSSADALIQTEKPFSTIKHNKQKAELDIKSLLARLLDIAHDLEPFMPETSKIISDLVINNKKPEKPLFARKD